jgi:2-keto-3-deoxy-L-rhamnonate aldolase RhmA
MTRTNLLREKLAGGGPLFGVFLSFPSPRLVEFSGLVGFDFVLIDGEHEGIGAETCYQLATAADAVGMASIVRAPINRPDVLLGYADSGVNGIIAPHVDSRAAAEALVSALAFPPIGTRGAAASSRAANYGLTQTPGEYFADTGNHPIPLALLEDVAAFDAFDEIVSVPGLDHFCLGSGDLAASLGHPGQMSHPEVVARVAPAMKKLVAAGKTVSVSAGSGADARTAAANGARLIVVSNASLLGGAARSFLSEAKGGVQA